MRRSTLLLALVPLALVTAYWWDALVDPVTVQAIDADDDVLNYFRPLNLFHFRYVEAFGELPGWLDRMGLGYPASAVGQHGIDYLPRLLAMKLAPTAGAAADLLVWAHALVGALAVFALARVYRIETGGAAVAATLYALAQLPVRWAPFFHAPAYFAFAPVALLGLELVWRRRPALGVPLLALGLGMAGLGTHLQSTHLLVQVLAVVAIFRFLTDGEPRRERTRLLGWSGAGAGVGLAAAAPVWLPFAIARGDSTRVESPISDIAGMTADMTRSFYDPTGALNAATGAINGDIYLGLVAPLLVVGGAVIALRRRDTAVLVLLLAIAALIAYKTPLLSVLAVLVPGWDVVSNVARLSFVAVLPMALLAGLALDRLLAMKAAGVAAGVAALVALSLLIWETRMDEKDLASAVPAVIGALAVAAAMAAWRVPDGRTRGAFALAIPALLAAMTFAGSMRERDLGWQPADDVPQTRFQNWLNLVERHDDPASRWMSHCQSVQAPSYDFRPITFLDAPGRWLDAYDSFVSEAYYGYWRPLTGSARYERPIGGQWYQHVPQDPQPDPDLVNAAGIGRIFGTNLCSLDTTEMGWGVREQSGRFIIWGNGHAYPAAYLSERWRTVPSRAAAVSSIARDGRDFRRHTDNVEGELPAVASGGPPRPAELVRGDSEHLTVRLPESLSEPTLLVVLEAFDDDWKARAGGEELETARVNGAFRGVVVPAGATEVTMEYDPPWNPWLGLLSGLALVGATAALAAVGWRHRREGAR
ncbi:MAG TPA: hypothetical protein VNT32_07465 [Thermoleophilaceae bacterium]|nr:hypothetical protein [Thermoleophilaceae bacterium]